MNIVYQIIHHMTEEKEPLYMGELVAIMSYTKKQIEDALFTLLLVGWVKKQNGFKKDRYFLVGKNYDRK